MFNRVSSQDVSASYASIGIVRVTFTAARQSAASPTTAETGGISDSVSLSPQALSAAKRPDPPIAIIPAPIAPPDGGDEGIDAAPVPAPPSPATSRVDGLAAALIKVLDTDGDGALSKDEFVEGAKALLGRGRARRRGDDDGESADAIGSPDRGRHAGRGHRLERRLEKAFGRIDADDNGSLDAGELAAVLARASRRNGGTTSVAAPASQPVAPAQGGASSAPVAAAPPIVDPKAPVPAEQQTAPPASSAPAVSGASASPTTSSLFSLSVTTVTFVSVAVQQYQAVKELKA